MAENYQRPPDGASPQGADAGNRPIVGCRKLGNLSRQVQTLSCCCCRKKRVGGVIPLARRTWPAATFLFG